MAQSMEFTDPELKLVRELLHGDEARLRFELAHTDHRAMKEQLRTREELLTGILGKIEGPAR